MSVLGRFEAMKIRKHHGHIFSTYLVDPMHTPCCDYYSRALRYVHQVQIIIRPHWVKVPLHFLRISCPVGENVCHAHPAISPALRVIDATRHGRIILVLIGGAGIQADKLNVAAAVAPLTPQRIAIPAAWREIGGA